jgi:hypothetical protein
VKCFEDHAQDADAANAGDQRGPCCSGVNADRWTGADSVTGTLGTDDFVIGDLDAKLVARLATM